MADINNNITCIKSNGSVWKFGKDPDTGYKNIDVKTLLVIINSSTANLNVKRNTLI